MTDQANQDTRPRIGVSFKLLVLAALAALMVAGYWLFRDTLTLAGLAEQETQLRELQVEHAALVYGVAFLVYVAVTGLSLPGATVLTLAYGWYFGVPRGLVLVSFASTSGATLAFLLSRFLFRETIRQRFTDRLAGFNRSLEREGPFYLFTLRLIPAMPFLVINAVMGLTPIRVRTFWWVSQLGMLPGTLVYLYAGASVPSLQTLADNGINAVFTAAQLAQIAVALALLGLLPLVVRWTLKIVSRHQRAKPTDPQLHDSEQSEL